MVWCIKDNNNTKKKNPSCFCAYWYNPKSVLCGRQDRTVTLLLLSIYYIHVILLWLRRVASNNGKRIVCLSLMYSTESFVWLFFWLVIFFSGQFSLGNTAIFRRNLKACSDYFYFPYIVLLAEYLGYSAQPTTMSTKKKLIIHSMVDEMLLLLSAITDIDALLMDSYCNSIFGAFCEFLPTAGQTNMNAKDECDTER